MLSRLATQDSPIEFVCRVRITSAQSVRILWPRRARDSRRSTKFCIGFRVLELQKVKTFESILGLAKQDAGSFLSARAQKRRADPRALEDLERELSFRSFAVLTAGGVNAGRFLTSADLRNNMSNGNHEWHPTGSLNTARADFGMVALPTTGGKPARPVNIARLLIVAAQSLSVSSPHNTAVKSSQLMAESGGADFSNPP